MIVGPQRRRPIALLLGVVLMPLTPHDAVDFLPKAPAANSVTAIAIPARRCPSPSIMAKTISQFGFSRQASRFVSIHAT
jgi:hypothetical protein